MDWNSKMKQLLLVTLGKLENVRSLSSRYCLFSIAYSYSVFNRGLVFQLLLRRLVFIVVDCYGCFPVHWGNCCGVRAFDPL